MRNFTSIRRGGLGSRLSVKFVVAPPLGRTAETKLNITAPMIELAEQE